LLSFNATGLRSPISIQIQISRIVAVLFLPWVITQDSNIVYIISLSFLNQFELFWACLKVMNNMYLVSNFYHYLHIFIIKNEFLIRYKCCQNCICHEIHLLSKLYLWSYTFAVKTVSLIIYKLLWKLYLSPSLIRHICCQNCIFHHIHLLSKVYL
jgi:hypothetical protein